MKGSNYMLSARPFLLFLAVISVFLLVSNASAKAPARTGKMEKPSGLQPVFPDNARCIEIASPYGSQTRYDGSRRPGFRFKGYHGGIDLSLAEGTPLLAIADGTVVKIGKGEQMEGIFLWLRHSPEDTGLSYWVYSKYQHLKSLPELKVGDRVTVGQEIAHSGKTGTTGGHYGISGYPHLHLSTVKSAHGKYSGGPGPDSYLVDPLVIYLEANSSLGKSVDVKSPKKTVTIPCVTTDGHIRPSGTRVVWPVACQPR
ncbi:MAG: M23 family metallopeptidase [Desulfobacterales bacterium]|nr:M23 family metallopeptidase [Desulfobacterales bacterium]